MVGLLLLLILFGLKLSISPGVGRGSLDGNFYFQIARHVADGDGLKTSVSLYHQGLKELPHATNQNPIWPLVLGHVSRWLGLGVAASVLPKLFYLISLVLLYFVANRVAAELVGGASPVPAFRGARVLNFGHLAMLLFGLDPIYFRFTSLPYTEALAFVLLWTSLLGAVKAIHTRSFSWGLVAGGAAALAFMTRAQFIGVPVVVLAGLLMWSFASRSSWRPLLGASIACSVALLAWVAFLASWIKPFNWRVMVALAAYRETPELSPYPFRVPTDSVLELWSNRLSGALTAFRPSDPDSYVSHFGAVALLVPLAVVVWLLDRKGSVRPRWRGAMTEQPLTWMSMGIGLCLLGPLHTMHFRFFREWLFGWRHGLPLISLIIVAVPMLMLSQRKALRWLASGLVLASMLAGSVWVGRVLAGGIDPGLLEGERSLVAFLESQSSGSTPSVTSQAQTLGAFSDAGFHWIQCEEPGSQTRALLDHTSAAYVVVYPSEMGCRFYSEIAHELELVGTFGSETGFPVRLYRQREASP